jgi:hypothetical protein
MLILSGDRAIVKEAGYFSEQGLEPQLMVMKSDLSELAR